MYRTLDPADTVPQGPKLAGAHGQKAGGGDRRTADPVAQFQAWALARLDHGEGLKFNLNLNKHMC